MFLAFVVLSLLSITLINVVMKSINGYLIAVIIKATVIRKLGVWSSSSGGCDRIEGIYFSGSAATVVSLFQNNNNSRGNIVRESYDRDARQHRDYNFHEFA